MELSISRIHFPVTTLGPGRRVGIWFQGCSIRCRGCISVDTWQATRGELTAPELVEAIGPWLCECDGVTISGGEPFDQPLGLNALLRELRQRFYTNVLVYSGYPYEVLQERLGSWSGLIDALISDPFIESVEQTKALRGSDNQRLHCLTPTGETLFSKYEHQVNEDEKNLDIMFDDEGTVWLAGIPTQGDLAKLRALLLEDGHSARITEATLSHARK